MRALRSRPPGVRRRHGRRQRTGCLSQLCASKDIPTTCEYLRRYACQADQVSVGKSLAADRRRKAKTVAKPGYGDQGDRARKRPKRAAREAKR